jgi:hypothetical protein
MINNKVLSFNLDDDYIIFHEEIIEDDYNYVIEVVNINDYLKIVYELDEEIIF